MAATETANRQGTGKLLAAALLLPGILPISNAARAETAPEQAVIATKYLDYQDSQPGLKRTHVSAPSLYLLVPFEGKWAVEATAVSDSVSGASPRYHTAISGASRQTEQRQAADVKVTRYGERHTTTLGAAISDEHDFHSEALSSGASFSSEDNNTTWTVGAAFTRDRISETGNPFLHKSRSTWEISSGISQNLSPSDLVQLSAGFSRGTGYFDDPYKFPDHRPDSRNHAVFTARWNHYVSTFGAALRSGYRYYADTFGIRAHTIDVEWAQPFGERLRITPGLRYYSQRAANFYFDPVYDTQLGAPFPPGWQAGTVASADQRLSAFGAVDVSLKMDLDIGAGWSLDLKLDRYQQRGSWRLGGRGSPGLATFNARWLQLGLTYRF